MLRLLANTKNWFAVKYGFTYLALGSKRLCRPVLNIRYLLFKNQKYAENVCGAYVILANLGSIVWFPFSITHEDRLESVQKPISSICSS